MKKKPQPLSHEFKMLRLFRDDLLRIESILKEQLKVEELKLSTADLEYDSVSEISEDTPASSDFTIQSYSPSVSITVGRSNARIYFSGNSLVELGAFTEIVNILEKRQRRFLNYFYLAGLMIAPAATTYSIGFAAYYKDGRSYILGLLALLAAVWGLASFRMPMNRVEFTQESTSPNFIKRNKDQIILSTIFTIFGAILGIIFTT